MDKIKQHERQENRANSGALAGEAVSAPLVTHAVLLSLSTQVVISHDRGIEDYSVTTASTHL